MLKVECDKGRVKINVKTSHGLGELGADLTFAIRGIIDSLDNPEDKEALKTYVSEVMPKLIRVDSLDNVLDELIKELIWGA